MNKQSSLEKHIIQILNKDHILFEREKQFKDFFHGKFRYDFYLPKHKICIECNGAQHYYHIPYFHKTRSEFLKAQERDRRKISYCLAHNIELYIIPYWEIQNIKTFSDVVSKAYRARSRYHNDEVWRHQKNKADSD